ncbi:MAG TPA: SgcJ/EcaC family oxidoreductase [Burkholderiales bacterium]|jgi:uncharacterized protein (TIGR02246 family)|nr:SgcJ/EcaC family oxidoreductase [Burkholderiales bacterium]
MRVMESVDALNQEMMAVWNRHDMEGFGNLYLENADFVNIFGDWLRGRAQIVSEHARRHLSMFRTARLTIQSTDVRCMRPDIVVVRSRWRMDGILDPEGNPAPSRSGLLMHVMERGEGGWRIVATQNTEIARVERWT